MTEFFSSEKDYGQGYKEALLSQYNTFLQTVDNLITRRTSANNFFLSVNTGLISLIGIIVNFDVSLPQLNNWSILGISIAGIIFAYSWFRTIKSYRQLSKVKWQLIWDIEKQLPIRLHEVEWERLGGGDNPSKYRKLTDVEKYIPIIFIGIYSILILWLIGINFSLLETIIQCLSIKA